MNEILPINTACPRCGGPFHCGAADKTCACYDLQIGPTLQAQLAADYSSCLCVACLTALLNEQKQKQEP